MKIRISESVYKGGAYLVDKPLGVTSVSHAWAVVCLCASVRNANAGACDPMWTSSESEHCLQSREDRPAKGWIKTKKDWQFYSWACADRLKHIQIFICKLCFGGYVRCVVSVDVSFRLLSVHC